MNGNSSSKRKNETSSSDLLQASKKFLFENKSENTMIIKYNNDTEVTNIYQNLIDSQPQKQSIHSATIHEVHEIPINIIIRPIQSNLDQQKIHNLIEMIKDPFKERTIPPIDVFWIEGSEGGDYYFGFTGLHRLEAYRLLGDTTIRAKIIKSCLSDLKIHLGGSTPMYLK